MTFPPVGRRPHRRIGLAVALVLALQMFTARAAAAGGVGPTPQPGGLNHFLCYEIHGRSVREDVSLVDDVFGATTGSVGRPKRLCAPADKNDEDSTAPGDPDHLIAYRLDRTEPSLTDRRRVEVTNQFGTLSVRLAGADMLLVPSAKSTALPPQAYVPQIDHFKCYRIQSAHFRRSDIKVDDQFGSIMVDIKRPRRLCVAVDKKSEGRIDPSALLLCYAVRSRSASPFAGKVSTLNQFEAGSFDVYGPRELCVPPLSGVTTPTPTLTPTPTETATATETLTPTPTVTPTPEVACANAGVPACDGTCPPGQMCFNTLDVLCICIPVPATVTPTPTATSVTPTPTVTPTPVCPNGICGIAENECTCPADCGGVSSCAVCGCGFFDPNATCACDINCVALGDCCPDVCSACGLGCCGDDTCDPGENPCACPECNDPNACEACECGLGGGASGCQCDPPACQNNNDCCDNAVDVCG